jgi:hypothetical protein
MSDSEGAIDFSGLANQAPRSSGYGSVQGPQTARADAGSAFEQAKFALERPPRPFSLGLRPPSHVSAVL